MNRVEFLRKSLPTWLALSQADRVVVVDWGSDVPVRQSLGELAADPKLTVARVEERHWCNSKCHNLELLLARQAGLWLRLDADVVVRPDFLDRHPPRPGRFYAGDWRGVPVEVDDKRNLSGVLLIDPRHVEVVNGYNERLVWYGREDDDLHARLVRSGIARDKLVLDTLDHIPHPDVRRYENLAIAPHISKVVGSLKPSSFASGRPSRHEVEVLISISEQELFSRSWTTSDSRVQWEVGEVSDGYVVCRRK
jgi:hypothetical protein